VISKASTNWPTVITLRCVHRIAKRDYWLRHVCLSVCLPACLPVCPSVHPSVRFSLRMEQVGSHWTDFREIWYLKIFRKSVEKIQVPLKSDKNNGHFIWTPSTLLIISRPILLRMINVSDKWEEIKTHILCSVNSFTKHFAVYEKMSKSMVQAGRPQMRIQHGAHALWMLNT